MVGTNRAINLLVHKYGNTTPFKIGQNGSNLRTTLTGVSLLFLLVTLSKGNKLRYELTNSMAGKGRNNGFF